MNGSEMNLDSSKDSEEALDRSYEDLANTEIKVIKDINYISNNGISNKKRLIRFMNKKLHSENIIKDNE